MGFNKSHILNSNFPFRLIAIPLVILLFSCSGKKSLFTQLTPEQTGINFINKNTDADSLSILDYLYYYNGGGVAIGDINNDGLPDIFFTSNRGGNKLYLNKGNMHFSKIRETASSSIMAIIPSRRSQKNGVSMCRDIILRLFFLITIMMAIWICFCSSIPCTKHPPTATLPEEKIIAP